MNAHQPSTPRHPIRVVSQRTGLPPDTLRIWERRYGVVAPSRSQGRQRLYSDADVGRLSLLVRATAAGRAIGLIANLSTAELERMVAEDELSKRATPRPAQAYRDRAWKAVTDLEPDLLQSTLRAAILALGGTAVLDDVVAPLLSDIGAAWATGRLGIAHEHAASVMVARAIGWLRDGLEPVGGAPAFLAATLPGERHELGAMLATAAAAQVGWQVTYLGPDLPFRELAEVAHRQRASVVALSVVAPQDPGRVRQEIADLRRSLDRRITLVVGGAGVGALGAVPPGVTVVSALGGLRVLLAELASSSRNDAAVGETDAAGSTAAADPTAPARGSA